MRHVLPLLLVVPSLLPSSEAIPLLELSGNGQVPIPAALRPTWEAALSGADAWAVDAQLPGAAASTAAAQTTGFHLTGWALPRANNLPPAPLLTGWWQGTSAPAAALASLASTWPGYQATSQDDRVTVTHAAAGIRTQAATPGISATILGEGLAASLTPLVRPAYRPWLSGCLAALPGWRLQASIDPTGQAALRTGIPAFSLEPVEPELLTSLPASALAVMAIGIGPGGGLGRLPPGTAVAAWLGGGRWVASFPDHTRIQDLITAWSDGAGPGRDVGETPAPLTAAGPWVAHRGNRWFLGSTADDLTLPAMGERWWGTPAPGTLGFFRLRLPAKDALAAALPSFNPEPTDLTTTISHPLSIFAAWPGNVLLDHLGQAVHGVTLHAGPDATAEVLGTYTGDILPWLVPTLAVRWCTDDVADQVGRRKLVATMQQLTAAGIPLTREALLATLPPLSTATATAMSEHWNALDSAPDFGDQAALRTAKEEFALPVHVASAGQLTAIRAFITRALAANQDPAVNAAVAWQALPPGGHVATMRLPHLSAWRNLARCGEQLVLHGDANGLTAVDAAVRISARPTTLIETLVGNSVRAIRDHAWLAACVQGLGDPTAWLGETPPNGELLAAGWQGEAIMQAWLAQQWLERGSHPLLLGADRAWGATEIAQILSEAPLRQTQPLREPTPWKPHSTLASTLRPATEMLRTQVFQSQLQHALLRFAGRLALRARTQELPADAKAVEQLLGQPLAIPWAGGALACRWQRLPDRGFRLRVDTTQAVPAGISAATWKLWQDRRAPDDAIAFASRDAVVQVHQVATRRTVDF